MGHDHSTVLLAIPAIAAGWLNINGFIWPLH